MAQPSFTQVTFRLRNDNGSETAATWKQIQGDDDTIGVDENFRVRFLIDEANSKAWSALTFRLFYSHNSGTYTQMSGTTPIQFSTSIEFTDGDDCTSQLTGGSGAFLTDNNGMDDSGGDATNTGAIDNFFECEFCVTIDSGQVSDTDTIELRVYNNVTAIASYTDHPVITVSVSGGTLYYQSNSGATTSAGILKFKAIKLLIGAMASSGNLIKKAKKLLEGITTSTGTISKKISELVEGAFTSSGILNASSKFSKALAGVLTSGGIISTLATFRTSLAGATTSTGSVAKGMYLALSGIFTSTGVLDGVKLGVLYFKSIAGSMSSVGTIKKRMYKSLSGAMSSTGNVLKKVLLSFSGAMDSSGVLNAVKQLVVYYKSIAGSMSSSGDISRKIFKSFSAVFTSSGYLNATLVGVTVYYKSIAGTLTSGGVLSTLGKFKKFLEGSITSSGEIVKGIYKTLFGTMNSSGDISSFRRFFILLTGTLVSGGEILRKIYVSFSGVMTSIGTIRKKMFKSLSGLMTSIGAVIGSWMPSTVLSETIVLITDESVYDVTIGSEGHT